VGRLRDLICLRVSWFVAYFFRLRILLFDLLKDREMLIG
jgi:hypothetical protein